MAGRVGCKYAFSTKKNQATTEKLTFKSNSCIVPKTISDYNLTKGSKSFSICFLSNAILSFYKHRAFPCFSVNSICIRTVFKMISIITCPLVQFDVHPCASSHYEYHTIFTLSIVIILHIRIGPKFSGSLLHVFTEIDKKFNWNIHLINFV